MKKVKLLLISYLFLPVILCAALESNVDYERQEIDNLKEDPDEIDEILSTRKCYYCFNCCTPHNFKLAEQAQEELEKEQREMLYIAPQDLNKKIITFKPYQLKMLKNNQISDITAHTVGRLTTDQIKTFSASQTKKLDIAELRTDQINALSISQIETLGESQIKSLSEGQIKTLLTHYANLLDIQKNPQNIPKIESFLDTIANQHTGSASIEGLINDFRVDTIFPLITDPMITQQKLVNEKQLQEHILPSLDPIKLVDIIKTAKSTLLKKWAIDAITHNFIQKTSNFPDEYIPYVDITRLNQDNIESLEPMQIQHFTTDQINNLSKKQIHILSQQQIEALSEKQIQALSQEQIQAIPNQNIVFLTNKIQFFTPDQIPFFSPMQITGFRPEEISKLSINQIGHLTKDQLNKLDAEQITVLLDTLQYYLQNNRSRIPQDNLLAIYQLINKFNLYDMEHEFIDYINEFKIKNIYPYLTDETLESLKERNHTLLDQIAKNIFHFNTQFLKYIILHAHSESLKEFAKMRLVQKEDPDEKNLRESIQEAEDFFKRERRKQKERERLKQEEKEPIFLPEYLKNAIKKKIQHLSNSELQKNMKSKSLILQTMSHDEIVQRKKMAQSAKR